GPVRAVRSIDIAIDRGETVAVLGPNGAGKSTTIDMLLGLQPPDSGSVTLFGRSPREAVDAGLIGAMLQTGSLVQYLSVRELLTMLAALYPAPLEVAEVLAQLSLEKLAGRRTQKLSGGETQRVRFAMALISNPDLLVLDEPTVAMDVESRHEFWDTMREFAARGKTVVFATHYIEEADQNADRVVLMANGRIVADGPPNEIKAQAGGRTIRASLPNVELDALSALAGVASAERRGEVVVLSCSDSDEAIRALLASFPQAREIEITGAALEDAFLALTADPDAS
ncbi:MAG TPA: ABC transporter ATP-binding protein, partial [Solirubrobacteraceae bacterium]|nr:ABC transporter ATP-binding protein [Solirubrobacteraceae bacterium]